jgi:hypothetical protein
VQALLTRPGDQPFFVSQKIRSISAIWSRSS